MTVVHEGDCEGRNGYWNSIDKLGPRIAQNDSCKIRVARTKGGDMIVVAMGHDPYGLDSSNLSNDFEFIYFALDDDKVVELISQLSAALVR